MFTLENWRERLNALGLNELWDELFRPGSPLAFLAAQGLRIAQPTLGVFADAAALASISALAERLESPEKVSSNSSGGGRLRDAAVLPGMPTPLTLRGASQGARPATSRTLSDGTETRR